MYDTILLDLLKEVDSSTVKAVGYGKRSNTLVVKFTSGAIYEYKKVPESIYEGLLNAESKGRYLNEQIKGKYEYLKYTK